MKEATKGNKKDYAGYEYKEITAEGERVSFLLDCYENFGWEMDEKFSESTHSSGGKKVTLQLKRNRKIMNKAELTRLQRNFEACVKEIAVMENSKTSAATAWALGIGFLGTACMACAVFAITAPTPNELLCVILSVPGFAGWALPMPVYKIMTEKKEQRLIPLIDAKYNEIDEICEKGHRLLI